MSLCAALLLAAVSAEGASAAATAGAPSPHARIERAVERAQKREALRYATVAVDVRTADTGRVVFARNAESGMTPASTMKLVTTAAALDAFGPDARFKTTLQSFGRQDTPGLVRGDLYLVGGGDPSLSRELDARPDFGVFELMAESLRTAGVRKIEGRVVGCDGLFSHGRRGRSWSWEDLVWWYGAEVSALTFADGAVNLKLTPGAAPGDAIKIERHPSTDYVTVDAKATTCRATDTPGLTLDRPLGGNRIEIGGCLAQGSGTTDRWVAVEDPALYAANVFADALRAKGIEVGRGVITMPAPPAESQVVATYEGAPLAEILKDVNKPSHNLRAEMLLRQVGVKLKGEGSVEAGREGVLAFLKAHDVDTNGWEIADGSGLSSLDLVTARGLTSLLLAMSRHPYASSFRDSLPVAGVDGTLKHRLGSAALEGRIVAKTGTMGHAYGLAGYARPRVGAPLVFAVLVNHTTATIGDAYDAVDAIVSSLVE